jgi:hypothetical protein
LNKYGLLPQGMSVETAQNLVTVGYKHAFQTKSFQEPTDNLTNALCLVLCWFTDDNVDVYGPLTLLFFAIGVPILSLIFKLAEPTGLGFLMFAFIIAFLLLVSTTSPLKFMCIATFGLLFPYEVVRGDVSTIGILGESSIGGKMEGVIVGFTGLQYWVNLNTANETKILLGFSLYAHIYNC